MIRPKSFSWERHWYECILEWKCLSRGALVWPYFSLADAQTASSPLGPEASRRGAKLVQRLSFTLRCEALQRTRWNTVACLNLTGNSSRSQLERPGWWFYSIFNILGRTLWEPGPHWLRKEIKNTENSFDILQLRLAKIPDITFFKLLSWPWFCYGFIIRISSLCLFNPQLPKAQPAGLNWLL